MAARLYDLAARKGYDMADFVEKTMISDLGVFLYDPVRLNIWSCEGYIMEWFEQQMTFLPKQREYRSFPFHVGYLYRYWMLSRELTSREVYKLAPFNIIDVNGMELGNMSWEDAIAELLLVPNGYLNPNPEFYYTCTKDPRAVEQLKGVYDLFGGSLI